MNEHKLRTSLNHLYRDLYKVISQGFKTVALYLFYMLVAFWIGSLFSILIYKIMHISKYSVSSAVDFSVVTNPDDKSKQDIIAHMDDGTERVITVPEGVVFDPTKKETQELLEKADREFYDDRSTVPEKAN